MLNPQFPHIRNSGEAASYLRRVMRFEQEEFWVLCLTSGQRLIASQMLFLGTVDRCMVHPRDIFRFAIIHNSARIIISHCHPMGEAHPSAEDIQLTSRLLHAGKILGIEIVDHIVLSTQDHSSCAESNLLTLERTPTKKLRPHY